MLFDSDRTAILAVISDLDRRERQSAEETDAKHKEYFAERFWPAASRGLGLGQAEGFYGTAIKTLDHDEHRKHMKSVANDVQYHCKICHEAVDHYFSNGVGIAPWPFMRLCIVLRKEKEFALEVDLIRALIAKVPDISKAKWFASRGSKAFSLLKKTCRD